jgi:uncharacterized protein YecE (DUF72 family)
MAIGCSGWNYSHWRDGVFYPPRLPSDRWLEFYAERFDTVEVNSSFYRLPRRETVARWAATAPEGFTFAVKVSRYVTHIRRLREAGEHLRILLDRIDPLVGTPKLGPLLWQLPASFRRDDARLRAALDELPTSLRHAFEFRHESWFDDDVLRLLREHGVALVIADSPRTNRFQSRELTAGFVYVRLHHGTRGRRGNYSRSELADWAVQVDEWSRRGDVFVYFNNDWEGFAPANAATLRTLLAEGRGGFDSHEREKEAEPCRL